jgi:hypothetical protein
MKTALATAVAGIKASDRRAYIRRAMWKELESRIRQCYSGVRFADGIDYLGGIFLAFSGTTDPGYARPELTPENCLNHAQISIGQRSLGLFHTIGAGPILGAQPGTESGAALIFTQDVTGLVSVLLHPYKSDLASVNEENILLAFGREPHSITTPVLEQYFRTFFRYCAATSAPSQSNIFEYAFRLSLLIRDIRNRRARRMRIAVFIERLLVLAFAALGIVATVWASSKWPF